MGQTQQPEEKCTYVLNVVCRKHGNPAKVKVVSSGQTSLVKFQASLNVPKPEKRPFFSCSSPAVTSLRCCAMQVTFEISAFTRDSHLTRIVAVFHCLL